MSSYFGLTGASGSGAASGWHGGRTVRILRLVPLGLQTQQGAQVAVHGAHHLGVPAAAALGRG
jgi:hypothetical protein